MARKYTVEKIALSPAVPTRSRSLNPRSKQGGVTRHLSLGPMLFGMDTENEYRPTTPLSNSIMSADDDGDGDEEYGEDGEFSDNEQEEDSPVQTRAIERANYYDRGISTQIQLQQTLTLKFKLLFRGMNGTKLLIQL